MKLRFLLRILGAFLCLLLSSGCLENGADQVEEDGTVVDVVPEEPGTGEPNPGAFVCDPFNTQSDNQAEDQGVIAKLFYLDSTQPHYSNVDEYFEFGHEVHEVNIFFNQLYVPTRPFDRGFVTGSGQTLETLEGDTLYEWFALQFRGKLHLGENDLPGYYQFAILADDGARLRVTDQDGNLVGSVDNDGFHPTKMGCGPDALYFDANTEYDFELDYFQGPRFHISLVLMWRPVPLDPSEFDDPSCGDLGNSLFFRYWEDPITPQPAYDSLLSRGWKPLEPSNYSLPGEGDNPCNEPAPIISNVQVVDVQNSSAYVEWSTDVWSTSQVIFTNLNTGAESSTAIDLTFVLDHRVMLDSLENNTLYSVKAISASGSGLTTESSEVIFRTLR